MIRKITEKDKNVYIKMADDFYHSDAVLHPIPIENIENAFSEMIKPSSYINGYIFEIDEQIAGYGIVLPTYSQEAGGLTLWIDEIYVMPQFRDKGLGSAFIDFISNTDGIKRIRLEAEPENENAMNLYYSKGFDILEYTQLFKENSFCVQ